VNFQIQTQGYYYRGNQIDDVQTRDQSNCGKNLNFHQAISQDRIFDETRHKRRPGGKPNQKERNNETERVGARTDHHR
jgi:hypothetical protein